MSGHYTWNDGSGTVSGTVAGSKFNGGFSETHYSGSFTLTLSGNSFTGSYTGKNKDTSGDVSGPFDGRCIAGPCLKNGGTSPSTGTTTGTTPAPGTLVITSASGEISARGPDGKWHAVPPGATLDATQEISTGIDSRIKVSLPDGDTFEVNELTQVLASSLINNTKDGRQTLAVQFKLGEIKAQVKHEIPLDTSLKVSTGGRWEDQRGNAFGAASVRGSEMDVFYDPSAKVMVVATLQDKSYWQRGNVTVTIPQGKEIAVTPTGVSKLAPIGRAGARGGIDVERAHLLAFGTLDRNANACGLQTAPGTAATAKALGSAGWVVTVPVTGKVSGNSLWRVSAAGADPANTVANRIAAGCA